MPFVSYLGIGAALIVASFVIVFSSVPLDEAPPSPAVPIATLEAIGSTTPFYVQLEALVPDQMVVPTITPPLATTTPEAPAVKPPVAAVTPTIPAPKPILPPQITPETPALPTPVEAPIVSEPVKPSTSIAAKVQAASVNILCTGNGGKIRGMSASGIIIDPRGVILTVAHAAQYYLLSDYPDPGSISCTIRTGNPARTAYTAKPIFISETWIKKNPDTLIAQNPRGTGEHDFALLLITGSATGASLPSSFPYIPVGTTDPKKGDTAIIGAYAAQALSSEEVRASLPTTIVTTSVKNVFTFTTNTVDLISLGGSVAAQTGSSGGGVVSEDGKLIAMITTSTNQGPYETRNINAITPTHMRRSFANDTGISIEAFLKGALSSRVSEFESVSGLRSTLVRALDGS
ncbi:MAG TPA: trypsin-like peptidase domain-containing protein [Candidatus Paceibacterota bacterium]|nr:trypsin-like peptidase domain-containing protein [Candidatus Paceibacterota bacterium]